MGNKYEIKYAWDGNFYNKEYRTDSKIKFWFHLFIINCKYKIINVYIRK